MRLIAPIFARLKQWWEDTKAASFLSWYEMAEPGNIEQPEDPQMIDPTPHTYMCTLTDETGQNYACVRHDAPVAFRFAFLGDDHVRMSDKVTDADVNDTVFRKVVAIHIDKTETSVVYERILSC